MGHRIKVKMLADISSRKELKQALSDLELRTWYAEKRLGESARDIFSIDNLVSLVMPSGGTIDRLGGGAMSGVAIVKGLFNAYKKFKSRRG